MKLRILQIQPKQATPRVTLQVDGRLIFNIRASELLKLAEAKSIILYVDDDSRSRDIYVEVSPDPPKKMTYRLRMGKTAQDAKPFFYAMTTKFFKEYGLPFEQFRIKFKIQPMRFTLEGGKLVPDKHGDRVYLRLVETERIPRGPKTRRNRRHSGRDQTKPFPEATMPPAPWLGEPVIDPDTYEPENFNGTGLPSNSTITIDHGELDDSGQPV